MISDLLAFLNARLDEGEGYAQWALNGPRDAGNGVRITDGKLAIRPAVMADGLTLHIIRHDPAHALRDVAAKRALIAFALRNAASIDGEWGDCHDATEIAADECRDHGMEAAYEVLKPLAAVDSDHVDYRQEWAVEGSSDAR